MHGMMDKLINSSGEMEDDLHEKRIMVLEIIIIKFH
jgi:hypothetical protein